jgi:hypothetical protein
LYVSECSPVLEATVTTATSLGSISADAMDVSPEPGEWDSIRLGSDIGA